MSNSVAEEVSDRAKPSFAAFPSSASHLRVRGLVAASAWTAAALITAFWSDLPESDWGYTGDLGAIFGAVAVGIVAIVVVQARSAGQRRLEVLAPWLLALAMFMVAWEIVTAKLGLLPLPFFPPPQAILEVVVDDRGRLVEGILASGRLLAAGYFLG